MTARIAQADLDRLRASGAKVSKVPTKRAPEDKPPPESTESIAARQNHQATQAAAQAAQEAAQASRESSEALRGAMTELTEALRTFGKSPAAPVAPPPQKPTPMRFKVHRDARDLIEYVDAVPMRQRKDS